MAATILGITSALALTTRASFSSTEHEVRLLFSNTKHPVKNCSENFIDRIIRVLEIE